MVRVCVTGAGDWENRGKEAKSTNPCEGGAINILKHCCFILIAVNNRTAIIIPRDLINYAGL